jgi:hypothetical protein
MGRRPAFVPTSAPATPTHISFNLVPTRFSRHRASSRTCAGSSKELERICAEGVGKRYSSDVDFGHASRVVEALARQGDKYADRIRDLLGQKVEDYETDPMTWLEIFLVELAGEMRLERAIPLVVKKLHECGEVLSEGKTGHSELFLGIKCRNDKWTGRIAGDLIVRVSAVLRSRRTGKLKPRRRHGGQPLSPPALAQSFCPVRRPGSELAKQRRIFIEVLPQRKQLAVQR